MIRQEKDVFWKDALRAIATGWLFVFPALFFLLAWLGMFDAGRSAKAQSIKMETEHGRSIEEL